MAMNFGQSRKGGAKELVLRGDASALARGLPKEEGSGIGTRTCNRNPEGARRATSLAASRGRDFEAQTTARKKRLRTTSGVLGISAIHSYDEVMAILGGFHQVETRGS